MNERLKKELRNYLLSDEYANTRGSGLELIAQHFYNLALEDVRKEIIRIGKYQKCEFTDGYNEACGDILNFIDNLTK